MMNLRLAVRQLIRSPGFTLLAIVTLGLGIGANTGDVQHPQFDPAEAASVSAKRAVGPHRSRHARRTRSAASRPPTSSICSGRCTAYGEIAAYTLGDTSLSEPGQPAEMVRALRATANFFSTLRVQPQLGRDFLPREDLAGNDRVLIISQRCWQQRFGGRADVIGRTLRVDGEPHEIVGVLPASINDWRHFGPYDFFRPLALDQQKSGDRRTTNLRLIGRRSDTLSPSGGGRFHRELRRASRGRLPGGQRREHLAHDSAERDRHGKERPRDGRDAHWAFRVRAADRLLESRQSSSRSHDGARPGVRRPCRARRLAHAVASSVDRGVAPARARRRRLLDRRRRVGHRLALLQERWRQR